MDGTMDAWIRLGDFSSRSDASPLEADDPAYGFSLACRLVAGIAGLEPRFVRWDEGGFIPGFIHPHSGRRVHLKNADDTAPAGIAPGGARILAEARDRKQRIEALRMEAISLGYDFIADAEAPARRQTHRSAEVIYKRHAAMARGLGGASTGVIDMSVVRACARVGVSIERARNILYWSPEVKSIREAARSRNPPAADGGEREARVYVADLINLAYLHPDSRTHCDATMRRWQSIRAEISEVVMGHEASQAVLKLFR